MTGIARRTGRLDVEGESLWYEDIGDGPALVLCHGLGGNGAVWYRQVPVFARDFRVVVWDQRGFGRSTNRHGRAGPVAAAADLGALLDHLEIARTHLVGQSMGGWAVLGAALARPDRVASLTFSATTGGLPVTVPEQPPVRGAPPALLGVHPALTEAAGSEQPEVAYLYQALGSFGDRPPDAEMAGLLARTTYDPARTSALDVPALFLTGELDRVIPTPLVRQAAAQLPGARLVVWPDSGHSAYVEQPDRWNAALRDFLTE